MLATCSEQTQSQIQEGEGMNIKQPTPIPPEVKITRVPAGVGKARSVYSLEKAHERKLERDAQLKARAERVTALLKAGLTVEEAMKATAG
jgi:hypothetical protein